MKSIDEEDVISELPELPKSDIAATLYPGGSRRKSSFTGRRMSKIAGSGPRRESMGVQRLINDFMKAAGLDYTKNNVSSVADKRLEEVAPNFAPKHVRTYCQEQVLSAKGDAPMQPFASETFAAVVMVDVSGYSKLSASLAEKGPIGSELLSKSMKGYLDKVRDSYTILNLSKYAVHRLSIRFLAMGEIS